MADFDSLLWSISILSTFFHIKTLAINHWKYCKLQLPNNFIFFSYAVSLINNWTSFNIIYSIIIDILGFVLNLAAIEMDFEYNDTTKGCKKLILNGYAFNKNNQSGLTTYWRCEKYYNHNGHARVITENDEITNSFAKNIHIIDAIDVAAENTIYDIR